ncbi:MAG: hypothetical protein ACLTT1_01735 [[Clostridium] scindens]
MELRQRIKGRSPAAMWEMNPMKSSLKSMSAQGDMGGVAGVNSGEIRA